MGLLVTGWLAGSGWAQDPAGPAPGAWKPLLAKDTLDGWKVVSFGGEGPVTIEDGVLTLGMGEPMTAVAFTNDMPRLNYEIALETRRVQGTDFPCGLTFPVGDTHVSLILGGWGGGVVGISCINGLDASENETGGYYEFKRDQWYAVTVAVTGKTIRVTLDGKKIIDLEYEGRKLGLRIGSIEECVPLGIASYVTEGQIRNVRIRPLPAAP